MSEYTDEILKRAGLKPGSKSTIIDSETNNKGLYWPSLKGMKQIEELGNPEIMFTDTGIYAVAGTAKKDQDERESVLAKLAGDPEKVADLTREERRFLESRGYVRGEDKRRTAGLDIIASQFMDGKEPSAFWTGKKPTYKKTR
jgi:hypothetical protein